MIKDGALTLSFTIGPWWWFPFTTTFTITWRRPPPEE